MTDQYQSSNSDENSPNPSDPRIPQWDKKARTELKERLYASVGCRSDATEALIPKVIEAELKMYDLTINNSNSGEEEMKDDNYLYSFIISDKKVMNITKELISKQINEWKGLRWWRFSNEPNKQCDTYSKWFKKAKCWQDQNQHKPLGHFWCLIFEELKLYTNKISFSIFCESNNDHQKKRDLLSLCLFHKCILSILKGNVRFERTRETPLLPIRVLTQSKQLQSKLYKINNGFTLNLWKQNVEKTLKKQKSSKRSNVANILSDKCLQCAEHIYQTYIQQLKQIIPIYTDLNINKINNGYGPSFAVNSSVESQRYSPLGSLYSASPPSIISPQPVPVSFNIDNNNNNNDSSLQRLDLENKQLKAELEELKYQLLIRRTQRIQSQRIRSPTIRIPMAPPPMINDEMIVNNGYYNYEPQYPMPPMINHHPNYGRRFYFPSHNNMMYRQPQPRPQPMSVPVPISDVREYNYNYYSPRFDNDIIDDGYTLPSFSPFDCIDNLA